MKKNAFTLIEVLAVFTIIAIIAVIGFVQLGKIKGEATNKAEILANANIVKAMEDYILTNGVRLTEAVPLYFSVNSLIDSGLLNQDINQKLDKDFDTPNQDTYFVSVTKNSQKVSYTILNKENLESKIGSNNVGVVSITNKEGTDYYNNITANYKESKTIYLMFKSTNNSLYDVIIKSIKYTLTNQVNGNVTIKTIKNIKKDKSTGIYYFNFKNNMEPASYDLKMEIETELSSDAGSIEGSFTSVDPNVGIVITNTSLSSNGWANVINPTTTITASGFNSSTLEKADTIQYSYIKYADINKTSILETKTSANMILDANGVGKVSFSSSGIYAVQVQSFLKGIAGTVVHHDVKVDNINPNSCTLTLRKTINTGTVINSGTWVNTDVVATAAGSDQLSGLTRTEIEFTGATTNRTNCISSNNTACEGVVQANGLSYAKPICYDAAGNKTIGSTYNISIDKVAPTILFSPNSRGTSSSPICAGSDNSVSTPVTIAVSDDGSGVNYYRRRWFDGSTAGDWSADLTTATAITTANAPGSRYVEVYAVDNLGNSTYESSGRYYLEGPIVSIYDSDKTYPVGSGSLKVYYKCDAWHTLSKNCDSKASTSTGSTLVYDNLDANIIDNTGAMIKKYTVLSHNNTYQYFWVRAGNNYCDTASTGYRLARIFD